MVLKTEMAGLTLERKIELLYNSENAMQDTIIFNRSEIGGTLNMLIPARIRIAV